MKRIRGMGRIAALAAMTATVAAVPSHAQDGGEDHDALFLAANVEWVLDHEMAHALIHEFDLPVLGQEEDAADSFASASVSARHEEAEAAARLAYVAELWFIEAERAEEDGGPDYFGEHDLDVRRGFRVLCVANGADPGIADAALDYVDVPDGGFDACTVDRDLATESWDVLIGPNTLFDDEPPAEVSVRYEPTDLDLAREALQATGAMEALADEAAETYALFDPLVIVARECGESDAFFDPEGGEIVMCYEFVADLVSLIEEAAVDGALGEEAGDGADAEGTE